MSESAPGPSNPSPLSSTLVGLGASWLRGQGADADVVVSSRVRLARNLAGFPFLSKASREQREQILELVRKRAMSAGLGEQVLWIDVHSAPQLDRLLMVERHLISREHAKGDEPRGVAISLPDERLSIMVNEEDQLRIQVLRSGLELSGAFEQIDDVDDLLAGDGSGPGAGGARGAGGGLTYAFSPRFGYLTACPTNVGTGMRVSVMLHLSALKLTGELEKVRRATKDMALAVRGYYGEGSDAAGDFYQISNQTTLGKAERTILGEFERQIIPQIIEYERRARQLLAQKRRRLLEDTVFRALGTLRYARLLTPEDALSMLSLIRLGVLTGLVNDVTEQTVNQLILLTQPAHLQRVLVREMDQNQRREARADFVRQRLGAG
jgi:protein arginine kinase